MPILCQAAGMGDRSLGCFKRNRPWNRQGQTYTDRQHNKQKEEKPMQLYPAIDMKDGQCVRLRQGEFKDITVYSDAPWKVAATLGPDSIPSLDISV